MSAKRASERGRLYNAAGAGQVGSDLVGGTSCAVGIEETLDDICQGPAHRYDNIVDHRRTTGS
jgi:hypothetical protein